MTVEGVCTVMHSQGQHTADQTLTYKQSIGLICGRWLFFYLSRPPSHSLTQLVSSFLPLSWAVNLKKNILCCVIIHNRMPGVGGVRHCQWLKLNMAPLKVEAIGENYDLWNLSAFLSLCKATGWCNLSWWRAARSIREDEELGEGKWKRLWVEKGKVEQEQGFSLPCCFPSITLGGDVWS